MGHPRSVLFICTGNSCRSVMAEALMRKKLAERGRTDITVRSAGVMALRDMPPTNETIEVMKEAGVDVSAFKAKNITEAMIRESDLILTMESAHKDSIMAMMPKAAAKTYLLKEYGLGSQIVLRGFIVRDPIGKGVPEYRMCRDEIGREIDRILEIV